MQKSREDQGHQQDMDRLWLFVVQRASSKSSKEEVVLVILKVQKMFSSLNIWKLIKSKTTET